MLFSPSKETIKKSSFYFELKVSFDARKQLGPDHGYYNSGVFDSAKSSCVFNKLHLPGQVNKLVKMERPMGKVGIWKQRSKGHEY